MSHSKWLCSAIIDIQPHMSGQCSHSSRTILGEAQNLLAHWYTHHMLHYPDDFFSLIMAGSDGTDYGFATGPNQYGTSLETGITMAPLVGDHLGLFPLIETAEELNKFDVRNPIQLASELIWRKYCENKRLQFGKQIVLMTSTTNTTSLRSDILHDYEDILQSCKERKHVINVYLHGGSDLDISASLDYGNTLAGLPAEDQQVKYWIQCHESYKAQGGWHNYDSSWCTDEPPFYIATTNDMNEWSQSGLTQVELSYILYYNINYNGLTGEEEKEQTRISRMELLYRTLARSTGGSFYNFKTGLAQLSGPFHRPKKNIVKFTGKLHLGPSNIDPVIDLAGYSFTLENKLPTLSTWNKNPDKGGIEDSNQALHQYLNTLEAEDPAGFQKWKVGGESEVNIEKVKRSRIYTDSDGNEVDPTTANIGWRYGKEDIIPMTQIDISHAQESTEKSMVILRAVKSESVYRWQGCSSVDLIQGHKDSEPSQEAVGVLAKLCRERKLSLLARYTRRTNGKVIFGVLVPLPENSSWCGFLFTQLPYKQDLRPYAFKPVYVKLTDNDVLRYNQWRREYDDDYLAPVRANNSGVKMEMTDDDNNNKNNKNNDKRPFEDVIDELFERQTVENSSISIDSESNSIPLLDPIQLQIDDDDVNTHKRWMIANRAPLGLSSHYLPALPFYTAFSSHPFFGYTENTLTEGQQLLKEYSDKLIDNNYAKIALPSPGFQRFHIAIKDRFMDPRSNIAKSIHAVENILVTPLDTLGLFTEEELNANIDNGDNGDNGDNDDGGMGEVDQNNVVEKIQDEGRRRLNVASHHLQTILTKFKKMNPVEIQKAVFDWRGRRQYVNPLSITTGKNEPMTDQTSHLHEQVIDAFDAEDPYEYAPVKAEMDLPNDTFTSVQNNDEKNNQIIKQEDVGLVIPTVNKFVISEKNPIPDVIKIISDGHPEKALLGLGEVLFKAFTQGQDGKPIKPIHNRTFFSLVTMRTMALQYDAVYVYNNLINKMTNFSNDFEIKKYFQKQQNYHNENNTNLYPTAPKIPYPNTPSQTYTIHPLASKFGFGPDQFPITNESFGLYDEAFCNFFKNLKNEENEEFEAFQLITVLDSNASTVLSEEEAREPFLVNKKLQEVLDFDRELAKGGVNGQSQASFVSNEVQNSMNDYQVSNNHGDNHNNNNNAGNDNYQYDYAGDDEFDL
jgi:hypothetical protein